MKRDVHVALLRGINVGGKNKLTMRELVGIFEALDCQDVHTYIQSGNVVFRAGAALAKHLPKTVAGSIAEQLGLEVPVVIRSGSEIAKVLENNPFLERGEDPQFLHVGFLAKAPTKAQVASLDPNRSPPDEFSCHGRELYFFCPQGVARSKYSNAYLDKQLATVTTVRNWRTTVKLAAMAAET